MPVMSAKAMPIWLVTRMCAGSVFTLAVELGPQIVRFTEILGVVICLVIAGHRGRVRTPFPVEELEDIELRRPGQVGKCVVVVLDTRLQPERRPRTDTARQFGAHFYVHSRHDGEFSPQHPGLDASRMQPSVGRNASLQHEGCGGEDMKRTRIPVGIITMV